MSVALGNIAIVPAREGIMTVTVERLTGDQIRARKAEILAAVEMTADELRAKAARYVLDSSERAALQELEDLEYIEQPSGVTA